MRNEIGALYSGGIFLTSVYLIGLSGRFSSDDHLKGRSGGDELLTLSQRGWLRVVCPASFHLSICFFFHSYIYLASFCSLVLFSVLNP